MLTRGEKNCDGVLGARKAMYLGHEVTVSHRSKSTGLVWAESDDRSSSCYEGEWVNPSELTYCS